MKVIDGKKIASDIKENLKLEIEKENLTPGLAIVMVGNNPASEIYVRNKLKACEEIGIRGNLVNFDEENSDEDIINRIQELNNDETIDGIIVQCPLPVKFNETKILNSVIATKDVDGFGLINLGKLVSCEKGFLAATPSGIIKMLEYENIQIAGKNVVVVGRSKIVGKPLALALLNMDATVTIAHSKTANLKEITNKADILIVAIGKDRYITSDYVKDGAVVIDVGINRINGKLYGDVDFDSVKDKCSYITPVPGGVGPMTIAMLLSNVVKSAKEKVEKE